MTSRRADSWRGAVERAAEVPDASVDALWRALSYLCVAQLYLRDNVLLERELAPADVKPAPSGHWGVCPSVNLVRAALAPIATAAGELPEVVYGAGHAGPAALAYVYLTGARGTAHPELARGRRGLQRFVAGFPHRAGVGGEITALMPGVRYMGGQLGPALAFACGLVLDRPWALAVPLIGDGECETGATAAAWLGARALRDSGAHGRVLPIVLLNGLRMGGPSLLSGLSEAQQRAYFVGLGCEPRFCDGADVGELRSVLGEAIAGSQLPGGDGAPVVVLTLAKGATGPECVGGVQILHTSRTHKTPLRDPAHDCLELAVLREWLTAYRPGELLTRNGAPTALVAAALGPSARTTSPRRSRPQSRSCVTPDVHEVARDVRGLTFGAAVAAVLARAHATGGLRLFSPDELSSNRVALDGARLPWVTEVLNEELCHCWLQGHVEYGGQGVLVSYEAFGSVVASLAEQYLKHLALKREVGAVPAASLNYVLTSVGWDNVYSHQNPSLVAALAVREDPALRLYMPADVPRLAASLETMLDSPGRLNVLVASKHSLPEHPLDTLELELLRGAAAWPHLSDAGEPDVVLAAAGDVPMRQLVAALPAIRVRFPQMRLRLICVAELTVLGCPARLPHALSRRSFDQLFGCACPVLLASSGFPAAVGALLAARGVADRFTLLGYHDPAGQLSGEALLRRCGLDADSLTDAVDQLTRGLAVPPVRARRSR